MGMRNSTLRNWSRFVLLLLVAGSALGLAACSALPIGASSAPPAGTPLPPGTVTVDIVALNHPPLRPVLAEVDQLLTPYGAKVHVTHYDFDTPQGADFAKRKGLTGHVPLAIFINGQDTFTLAGRKLNFVSFPQGEGTGMVADGQWTMADLDTVLKQATAQ
jgi:ABC-type glycerol-3-phosphate transport system substrate-binding protein